MTSCELNEYACRLHRENVRTNKVDDRVEVLNIDAADSRKVLSGTFDRVLMPYPSASDKFLRTALSLTSPGGMIHYYRHVLGRNEAEAGATLKEELDGILPPGLAYGSRRVREVGPRWVEMVADIRVAD